MTPKDTTIIEAIRKIDEVILTLTLQKQSLASQLPETKPTKKKASPEYWICPVTGKREWIGDKKTREKNKARHERGLRLIKKEAS